MSREFEYEAYIYAVENRKRLSESQMKAIREFAEHLDTRNLTLRETDTGIPAGFENTSSEAIPGVVDEIEELWDDTPQS